MGPFSGTSKTAHDEYDRPSILQDKPFEAQRKPAVREANAKSFQSTGGVHESSRHRQQLAMNFRRSKNQKQDNLGEAGFVRVLMMPVIGGYLLG